MGSPYKIRVSKQLLRHDVLSVEWMDVGSYKKDVLDKSCERR